MFHAWFYPLSCVLFQLWSTFHMISWTNLLTRAIVPAACFLLFLVPGKSENEYSRNWTDKSQSYYFMDTWSQNTRRRRARGRPHHLAARPGLARTRGWCSQRRHPLGLSFRLYIASDMETLSTRSRFHERVYIRRHLHP